MMNKGLSNFVSVKELCKDNDLFKKLQMDDSTYTVPKYDWNRTKFLGEVRDKKLNYIMLFPEKLHPRQDQLVKIFAKKKHDTPGPERYDMTLNWSKRSGKDYE